MFHYQDRLTFTCVSGRGGPGAVSFRRNRQTARGGPDGGDGGRGGRVVFSSKSGLKGFGHLKQRKRFSAAAGGAGESRLKTGAKGEDIIIPVPVGTVLRDESACLLRDFRRPGTFVLLKGGVGGKGNAEFKTSLNQAPRRFQKGGPGREKKIILEFKPLIKAGLIGRANGGKSTFFNTLTGARSPTADYPYTTLTPYYGRIKNLSPENILMDIPGISQGAHKEPERGLSFLRSLQRAVLLIHFIDSTAGDPLALQKELKKELTAFDKKFSEPAFSLLSEKKRLTVLTKIDLLKNPMDVLRRFPESLRVFTLSNRTGEGIKELSAAIKRELSPSSPSV